MPAEQINLTLGTAGHIDHGKTALVKCLTGCDTDRLKEEKERGLSIELGFAPCVVGDLQVGIVDVPGHENFIKTMVAGAAGVDAVMLVVAADDGIMPQTREHMDILTLLGIRHGLIVLTKIDRVGPERVEQVRAELRGYLSGTFLADAPILPVSNVTFEGLGDLHQALGTLVRSTAPRRTDGVFRLPVERTFTAKGYGTVICGIPVSGQAAVGDEVVLLPHNVRGRIKAIQVFKRPGKVVLAGQCTAINIPHLEHSIIERGHVIATPGYFEARPWCVGLLRLLPHEGASIKSGTQLKLHTGTSELLDHVYPLESTRLEPGQEALVQFRLESPLTAGPGDRFIVRSLSPVRTIGGGMLIDTLPQRLKLGGRTSCPPSSGERASCPPHSVERPPCPPSGAKIPPRPSPSRHPTGRITLEELRERVQAIGDDKAFIACCARWTPQLAIKESELSLQTKLPPSRVRAVVAELIREGRLFPLGSSAWIHADAACAAEDHLLGLIEAYHRQSPESPGLTLEELRTSCSFSKEVLDGLIARLKTQSRLTQRNHRLALPSHRENLAGPDQQLFDAIDALYRQRLFNPPGEDELAAATGARPPDVQRVLKILLEHERLIRTPDGPLFHKEAVEKAREILVATLKQEGKLESVRWKYLLNTTRKYAIPLLDYFDRIGVTRRLNNTRYLKT